MTTKITTIKAASRAKGSIIPKNIIGETIILSSLIKEQKESGSIVSLSKIDTDKKTGIYHVQLVWWSFDDAGDDDFFFENLQSAEKHYNYLNLPLSEVAESVEKYRVPPVTIFVPGVGEKRRFAILHNGYLAESFYDGDFLKPLFNLFVVEKLGLLEELKSLDSDTDIRELDPKFFPCLLKEGENEGGRIVTFEKTLHYEVHNCWETGFDFCKIMYRYPKEVFDLIRSDVQYHSEEIEEEGNWKGWYFLDKDKVSEKLNTIGWKLA